MAKHKASNADRARRQQQRAQKGSVILKAVIVLLMLSIMALFAVGFVSFSQYTKMKGEVEMDKIYNNIFINDINVGGLTKEEAAAKLNKAYADEYADKTIILKAGENSLTIPFTDFNPKKDFGDAIETAYSYARKGFIVSRYDQIVELETNPHKIQAPVIHTYDESKIEPIIVSFAEVINVPAKNASIEINNGVFTITPEVVGTEIDVPVTVNRVKELLDADKSGIAEALFNIVEPKYTAAQLETAKSKIGSGSSVFVNAVGRNENILNAASKINNTVLYPGEIFSTNEAFGEMSFANGYRMAPVIESGKLVDGMGGGVCQVSSTLYNAILDAELKIVERQNHSLKVAYMDWGFDATLAGNYIDLKFQNDTEYPVFIEAYTDKNNLIVNLYGQEIHGPTRKLEFKNALTQTIPAPAEKIIKDPSLPAGTRKIVTPARPGYKYEVYKIIYENGVQVDKVLVNKSYYKENAAEVHEGTGQATAASDSEGSATVAADQGNATPAETVPPAATSAPVATAPPVSTAPPIATVPPIATLPPYATAPPVTGINTYSNGIEDLPAMPVIGD